MYAGEVWPIAARSKFSEDVQHLEDHHPAARRPVGGDSVAAIASPERLGLDRGGPGQIRGREQAAAPLHVRNDPIRDLSGVEVVRPTVRNAAVGPAHVGVAKRFADLRDPAMGVDVDLPRRLESGEVLGVRDSAGCRTRVPEGAHVGPDLEPLLAPVDRGPDEVGQRAGAEAREGVVERA